MNEIFKRFIEIADRNNYDVISIGPIDEDEELFEEISDKLKELLNFKGQIDLIYIMEVKGRIILSFPVVKNIIREDLMLKLEDIFL